MECWEVKERKNQKGTGKKFSFPCLWIYLEEKKNVLNQKKREHNLKNQEIKNLFQHWIKEAKKSLG